MTRCDAAAVSQQDFGGISNLVSKTFARNQLSAASPTQVIYAYDCVTQRPHCSYGFWHHIAMALLRLLAAPIRRLIRFPLFQFAAVVVIVFLLQAADEHSFFGWIFDQLDQLVAATVLLCSNLFQ